MNTFSRLFVVFFLSVGPLSCSVSALSVTLERIPGYQMGYGGEFLATPDRALPGVLDSYSPLAKLRDGFFTFCLERDAPVTFKKPHIALFNDFVVGVGGAKGGEHGTDPISNGTAWLYQQFATGVLEGYDYIPPRSTARKLQTAIWWLEGEVRLGRPGQNPFLHLAFEHFNGRIASLADNDGSFGVRVLNLGRGAESPVQDMLVYSAPEITPTTTVPDGGETLVLLAPSLLIVGLVRHKAYLRSLPHF
jgi:hypothetical protein